LIFCLGGGIGWGSILPTSGILFNLMWTLWWERNRRTFEDEEQSMAGLENILSLFLSGQGSGVLRMVLQFWIIPSLYTSVQFYCNSSGLFCVYHHDHN
jgi:hypothetical protein